MHIVLVMRVIDAWSLQLLNAPILTFSQKTIIIIQIKH